MATRLNEFISDSQSIAIVSHINPDADAIASSLALKKWIEKNYNNISVDIFFSGEIGDLYYPLLESEQYNTSEKDKYDLTFVLDCPTIERTGNEYIINKSEKVIKIDHHENQEDFGNYRIVAPACASTGELLFLIFNSHYPIVDKKIAELIYHTIVTDTNCFKSFSLSKRTYGVLKKLEEFEIDTLAIKNHYFGNISRSKRTLLKRAMKSIRFECDDRISIMSIDKSDFELADADFTDTLGIVETGLRIEGVDIAIIIIEKSDDEYYISLRSKNEDIDVGEIAQNFGGGGKKNMAAFQCSPQDIQETIDKLILECSEVLALVPSDNDIDF